MLTHTNVNTVSHTRNVTCSLIIRNTISTTCIHHWDWRGERERVCSGLQCIGVQGWYPLATQCSTLIPREAEPGTTQLHYELASWVSPHNHDNSSKQMTYTPPPPTDVAILTLVVPNMGCYVTCVSSCVVCVCISSIRTPDTTVENTTSSLPHLDYCLETARVRPCHWHEDSCTQKH